LNAGFFVFTERPHSIEPDDSEGGQKERGRIFILPLFDKSWFV
jgi:hypothetical protein